MKIGFFLPLLAVVILGVMVFSNCDLKETGNPGLNVSSLKDLGMEIGKKWENTTATNVTISKSGNWDSVEIDDPVVIKRDNKYMMWYSGKGPDNKWRIGYAISYDGTNWTKDYENNPVIDVTESSIDFEGARVSSVIYDEEEGKYEMWYRGFDPSANAGYLNCRIIHAKSDYGNREWYKSPASKKDTSPMPKAVNLDKSLVDGFYILSDKYTEDKDELGKLCVFKYVYQYAGNDVTNYILWYTYDLNKGVGTFRPAVMTAYSDNETSFISNPLDSLINYAVPGSFFLNGYSMPTAIRDYYNGKMIYKMWFMSYINTGEARQAGYAYNETDGMFYVAHTKNNIPESVFTVGSIDQDAKDILNPCVIRDDEKYKMWYIGVDALGIKTVCYKESLSH